MDAMLFSKIERIGLLPNVFGDMVKLKSKSYEMEDQLLSVNLMVKYTNVNFTETNIIYEEKSFVCKYSVYSRSLLIELM